MSIIDIFVEGKFCNMRLHIKSIVKSLLIAIIIFIIFIAISGTKVILGASIMALIAFFGNYGSFLYEQHKLKKRDK